MKFKLFFLNILFYESKLWSDECKFGTFFKNLNMCVVIILGENLAETCCTLVDCMWEEMKACSSFCGGFMGSFICGNIISSFAAVNSYLGNWWCGVTWSKKVLKADKLGISGGKVKHCLINSRNLLIDT